MDNFKYVCECNFSDCHLKISAKYWEPMRKRMENRDYESILHPKCTALDEYKIIEKTKYCVRVVYNSE
jgi:hypothetical protein